MSLASAGRRAAALSLVVAGFALIPTPAPAGANIGNAVCGAAGLFSGIAGKACKVLEHGKQIVGAGKQLATGHVGQAVKTALGGGSSSSSGTASTAIGLAGDRHVGVRGRQVRAARDRQGAWPKRPARS